MVSRMKFIFLNRISWGLLLLAQAGPPAEMVDTSTLFDGLLLLFGGIPWLAFAVQMLRKLVVRLQQNKSLGQFLKEKGNGRVPGDVSFAFRSQYFRIAEGVNLEFRKLERLITSSLPGDGTLLEALFKLQAEIYHHLQKRFNRGG